MKIPFNTLDRQFFSYQEEYEAAAQRVLRSGWYILGKEGEAFEEEFARYIGTPYCIGMANGLDALILAFQALDIGPGDEVMVASNAYIACVMGITANGATPVLVEPDRFYNIDPDALEKALTPNTKAVLAVHLYGQACQMKKISDFCQKHQLFLVEDCAQSHGAKSFNKMTGTWGIISCFSFYPSKNLGCFGDGGAVTTGDESLAKRLRTLRNYGSSQRYHFDELGRNSRLDELQAALLRVKLRHLDELQKEREAIAGQYLSEVRNPHILLPRLQDGSTSVYHIFAVTTSHRDALMKHLEEKGIATIIHYPIPPHLSKAYAHLGYQEGDFPVAEKFANEQLSLPLYNGMTEEELDYVVEALNQFPVL